MGAKIASMNFGRIVFVECLTPRSQTNFRRLGSDWRQPGRVVWGQHDSSQPRGRLMADLHPGPLERGQLLHPQHLRGSKRD